MGKLIRRIRRNQPFSVVSIAENAALPIGRAFGGCHFGGSNQLLISAPGTPILFLTPIYY